MIILGSLRLRIFTFALNTQNMNDLQRSSEETSMNTWTSQAWNGTKVLKQLIQRKTFLTSLFTEIEKRKMKFFPLNNVNNFPTSLGRFAEFESH